MALCSGKQFGDLLSDSEGVVTDTFLSQARVEDDVELVFRKPCGIEDFEKLLTVGRPAHIKYLQRGLESLSGSFTCLDASRPWLAYWMAHSLALLKAPLRPGVADRIVDFLKNCQDPGGGFCGGPQQSAHLAPTYAAISALCTVGTEAAYNAIDRTALFSFLMAVRKPDGSFSMEEDGEVDVRGCYCAVSVAVLCGLDLDTLFQGTADWIASCQTYEGGYGGQPGAEAHGGYSFCAVAALCLLGRSDVINVDALLHWAVHRQMRFEGGFQGRTNKLVDGCYSFWQGGLFPCLHHIMAERGLDSLLPDEDWLYDRVALQEYILLVAQEALGGFVDKPGKGRDFYHTCYVLSGLASAQHFLPANATASKACLVVGPTENLLEPTHIFHNVVVIKAEAMKKYFET
eukprot:comp24079_c0_seq6/m.43356 comp24079_c0_seq6/g.43356  ORF comp24079_c0_seq6/g.43356 comp24079_c0_seq6/m.43356 type:complete len:402 (-) comp24079_c0_seq6:362-1567(-)